MPLAILYGNRFILQTLCLRSADERLVRVWSLALAAAMHEAQYKTHDSIVNLLRVWDAATRGDTEQGRAGIGIHIEVMVSEGKRITYRWNEMEETKCRRERK